MTVLMGMTSSRPAPSKEIHIKPVKPKEAKMFLRVKRHSLNASEYFLQSDILFDPITAEYSLLTAKARCDLFTYITEPNRQTSGKSMEICRQLMAQVKLLHRLGITHRDLKPENILIYDDGAVICDYGLSVLDDEMHFGGTLPYAAPEILQMAIDRQQTNQNMKPMLLPSEKQAMFDIWALGMTFFVLFARKHLWPVATPDNLVYSSYCNSNDRTEWLRATIQESAVNPSEIPPGIYAVIAHMLNPNAEERSLEHVARLLEAM